MNNLYDIILRPVVTEKSTNLQEVAGKFVFRVARHATKNQIREAIEKVFDVKVEKINTMIVAGKPKRVGLAQGRRRAYKKAVVTLAEGHTIDFYALENAEAGTV